jgi:GNAT superfamily N-acetyltransferase
MGKFEIIDRDLTPNELERMRAGFNQNTIDHGIEIQSSDRFGFVALKEDMFIGCSSGLAYKSGDNYSGWFYLTDLFVEKEYRLQGLGSELLAALEKKIVQICIRNIWTWTAGYEAPEFYIKQRFEVFAEMENWYSDGSSRFGLRKKL